MATKLTITARMDAAFERAAWRFPESTVRWIYLSDEDWSEYDLAVRKMWKSAFRCFSYRDVPIRSGKRSRLTTNRGGLVCIPRRLSSNTQYRKAA